jgi:hypothetical protein
MDRKADLVARRQPVAFMQHLVLSPTSVSPTTVADVGESGRTDLRWQSHPHVTWLHLPAPTLPQPGGNYSIVWEWPATLGWSLSSHVQQSEADVAGEGEMGVGCAAIRVT